MMNIRAAIPVLNLNSSVEQLSALKGIVRADGSVTAGNASGVE
jgi:hypothetical protein